MTEHQKYKDTGLNFSCIKEKKTHLHSKIKSFQLSCCIEYFGIYLFESKKCDCFLLFFNK